MNRDQVRSAMPGVAAVVDEFKAALRADQVRVTWAREGEIEVGRRDESEWVQVSPPVSGSVKK